MSHTVYYGCWDSKLVHDIEPLDTYVYNNILNTTGIKNSSILACPAFKDTIKNTFIVKSTYKYTIDWDGARITSPMYDRKFFETYLHIRDANSGFVSYRSPSPCFISESKDLNITESHAYFHSNDITNKSYTIPGYYNIGKHLLRPLELAIKFKVPSSIRINEGDALYYIKFHTEEKIQFKKFVITPKIINLCGSLLNTREYTQNFKGIKWWYDLVAKHNYKNYIINEIKQNLL